MSLMWRKCIWNIWQGSISRYSKIWFNSTLYCDRIDCWNGSHCGDGHTFWKIKGFCKKHSCSQKTHIQTGWLIEQKIQHFFLYYLIKMHLSKSKLWATCTFCVVFNASQNCIYTPTSAIDTFNLSMMTLLKVWLFLIICSIQFQ